MSRRRQALGLAELGGPGVIKALYWAAEFTRHASSFFFVVVAGGSGGGGGGK